MQLLLLLLRGLLRAALSSHFLLFVTTKSAQIASSTLRPTEKKMCKISDLINLSNPSILQGFKIPNQSVTWQLFGFLHSSSDQLVYASFIRVTAVDAHKPPVFISAFCFRVVPHLKHTNHSIFFYFHFVSPHSSSSCWRILGQFLNGTYSIYSSVCCSYASGAAFTPITHWLVVTQ